MINEVIDIVLDYLEQEMNLFTVFSVDSLGDDENALAIRSTPSSPGSRFLNNSRDDVVAFQILVKNTNQLTAIKTINDISAELESLNKDKLLMENFIDCRVYTYPTFVEKTERGSYIYTALFNLILNQGGE